MRGSNMEKKNGETNPKEIELVQEIGNKWNSIYVSPERYEMLNS